MDSAAWWETVSKQCLQTNGAGSGVVCGHSGGMAKSLTRGHYSCMKSPLDRVARSFFTALALAVICVPLLGLASSHSLHWGTVPEWVGAVGLLLIAAGVWRLARNGERERRAGDTRKSADA